MRHYKYLFMLLVTFITTLAGTPVMAAEDEKSTGQWFDWLGLLLEKVAEFIVLLIRDIIVTSFEFVVSVIKSAFLAIGSFLSRIWIYVCDFFLAVLKTFQIILEWFNERFMDAFFWLREQILAALAWCVMAAISVAIWALTWTWWVFEWLIEAFFWGLDWGVGIGVLFIDLLIIILPVMDLPAGLDNALLVFLNYGMLVNGIFPFKETLVWLGVYISVYVTVMIYRIIKSFIPFIAT